MDSESKLWKTKRVSPLHFSVETVRGSKILDKTSINSCDDSVFFVTGERNIFLLHIAFCYSQNIIFWKCKNEIPLPGIF